MIEKKKSMKMLPTSGSTSDLKVSTPPRKGSLPIATSIESKNKYDIRLNGFIAFI